MPQPAGEALPSAALSLARVVQLLHDRYDPQNAEPWDAVGLVCGDPEASVRRVLFAVDPVAAVVDEAIGLGADLLVVHHPLFLRGVHGVPATDPKGRLVHRLIRAQCGLLAMHTNADVAADGVADGLAQALGLQVTGVLVPVAGNGRETSLAPLGTGRVGRLPQPLSLAAFAELVAERLPGTASGVRVSGDPDDVVSTVALCGGAGDSLFPAVRASGADVYLTSDLRHHPASEFRAAGGCALVDVAHWAGEWPWLARAAVLLAADVAQTGAKVVTSVSSRVTDPWNWQVGSRIELR
jgi:dinuclear metal center YbgI/SA1388 family protein